jgi:hypothetical protein
MNMDRGGKPGIMAGTAPAIKENIFSIIRRASEEGITDGRRTLWIDFTPHIAIERKEDGYTVWLWRDCVVVKITLDENFGVTGYDVEVRP